MTDEIDSADSAEFTITKDGQTFNPPYVKEVIINSVSKTSKLTDLCGNEEERKRGAGNWTVDAKGLMLKPDLKLLKAMQLSGSEAMVTSEPHSGPVIIKDPEITQSDVPNTARFKNRSVTEATRQKANSETELYEGLVFSFHIQTKDPGKSATGVDAASSSGTSVEGVSGTLDGESFV